MSEFDKEAEREKLREKYAEDEQEREATQRMSDLLLQGATMTNTHCDRCGDPLFRHEGEAFCPTCGTANADTTPTDQPATQDQPTPQHHADRQNGTDTKEQSTATDDTPRDATATDPTPTDATATDTTSQASTSGTDTARTTNDRIERTNPDARATRTSDANGRTPAHSEHGARRAPPSQDHTSESAPDGRATEVSTSEQADLDAIEASLSRTLARLTTDAENGDLAATRERLVTVREAATALEAVRDARQ